MRSGVGRLVLAGAVLLAGAGGAGADGPQPSPVTPGLATGAERHYQQGRDAQARKDWRRAAEAYEAAIRVHAAFPEAWNGLGYALRQQGRYAEAVRAYDRALALRPDYAEALEYLGEAYVRMGRLDDARRVLERLAPLDPKEAAALRAAIEKARR
jgi:tetratricopeptide (TPR) repeat protein